LKSFPPPLTPKEESELLRRSADGDNEARHILIERNLRLVAHVIKKYQHLEDDTEDLLSIGTIGLIKAVSTFNPDKKARLATYACRCIENELLMMLRTKRKSNRETSLYEPIGTDREGNEIRLYDVIESDEEDACMQLALKNDISLLYEKLESVLTDREQLVLKKRYGLYEKKNIPRKKLQLLLASHVPTFRELKKGRSKNSAPAFFLLIFNFCRSRSCLSILKFMMLLSHRQTGHSTQTFLYQKAECQVPERRYLQAQAPAEFSFSLLAKVPCRIPAVLYGSGNSPHKSETVLPKHK